MIIYFIFVFLFCVLLFLIFYKPFGGFPNKADLSDYSKRFSDFNGKFPNLAKSSRCVDRFSSRSSGKGVKPMESFPVLDFSYVKDYSNDDVLVTWFGHSTVFVQMHGFNILIDPIFSLVASPFCFGPKRFSSLPCSISDLPNIDFVVFTHEHYDHLDYKSVIGLKDKVGKFIVPLGVEKDLERFGISSSKIVNMSWWEEIDFNGLVIACTPCRHYSGRFVLDKGLALYSSFVFKDSFNCVFFSGDTGYSDHFKEIGKRFDIDFAMVDSGQYSGKWHGYHMFPEEAVSACIDLNSKLSMPVHWGAFSLSNHSFDDPVNRFVMRTREKDVLYMMPKIGKTVSIRDYKKYQVNWWKGIR